MITFDNTGKAYRNRKGEIRWVLRNINTIIPDRVSVGILASEGQGKSTLINLAAGNEAPSEGYIYRNGGISWPYTFKGIIAQKLSGKQNLRFLTDVYGRNFKEAYDFVDKFSELGRYLDMPLRHYSPEMKARLAISALFAMDFDRILVDDTMEGGDFSFRQRCAQHLANNADRISFLIASSNPSLIQKYCQVGGVLHEGRLSFYNSVEDAIVAFREVSKIPA